MAKDENYIKMIHTSRWLKLRRDKLSSNPICERCWDEGEIITPATEVHHIIPVESAITRSEKERLMFNPSNLKALCHDCHVRTHTELGRSGKEATRKRNDQAVSDVISRFFGDG